MLGHYLNNFQTHCLIPGLASDIAKVFPACTQGEGSFLLSQEPPSALNPFASHDVGLSSNGLPPWAFQMWLVRLLGVSRRGLWDYLQTVSSMGTCHTSSGVSLTLSFSMPWEGFGLVTSSYPKDIPQFLDPSPSSVGGIRHSLGPCHY